MKNFIALKKYSYKNLLKTITLIILFATISTFSQEKITGLSDWNIYLDPGHSQYENMGIYGYSEAEKNLGVALNLRQMLLDWTDIDTVYICRTNNQQSVTLSQRTDQANALGAAHYHSIHSDAATMGSSANSTLIMWGQMGIGGPEKTPYGGKKMSQIMVGLLTAGMRTNTRGAMGDRDFYQVDNPYPYLHVNRESAMASELSEAGFHTNPTQNQLNMNEKWKRLEAKTMFWTILKYHNIPRLFAGTVVGIIKDSETGLAVNGAVLTLDGQVDTTDTWESLFNKYSSDHEALRNGFYYFENIPTGTHQLEVNALGFEPYTVNVTTADTFFTFKDLSLIPKPPFVTSTSPIAEDSLYPGENNLVLNFSRPMNKTSVESNITINPQVTYNTSWSNNDKTLIISTINFSFSSTYEITVPGNVIDRYNHPFDGNGDGISGDPYSIIIYTKRAIPSKIISTSPVEGDSIYPGINSLIINFSKQMNQSSVQSNLTLFPTVSGTFTWSNNSKTLTISTENFIFDTTYQLTVKGTALDLYNVQFDGNGDTYGGDDFVLTFRTKIKHISVPIVQDQYPIPNAINVELKPIISVTFSEPLKTSTISANVKIIRNSTQTPITTYLTKYYIVTNKSVLNFFITSPLAANETYTVKVFAGLQDSYGNPTTSDYTAEFTTGNSNYVSRTIIDNFDAGINVWWQPETSDSTIGILPDLTAITSVSSIFNLSTGSTKSMMFDYGYDENANVWLINESRTISSPSFDNSGLLQVFIFGDGNNNQFRFALKEINSNTFEVSPWYDIDWIGWKVVNWDLSEGQTGSWAGLGNGILEPPFIFDSFQFTYQPGNASQGKYYLDDLRTATLSPTDVKQENNQLPITFELGQNYPNPFNPSTQIKFSIAKESNAKLIVTDILGREVATLVNDNLAAGNYSVTFDAKNFSSGIYFYTLIADNFKQTHKMILMK